WAWAARRPGTALTQAGCPDPPQDSVGVGTSPGPASADPARSEGRAPVAPLGPCAMSRAGSAPGGRHVRGEHLQAPHGGGAELLRHRDVPRVNEVLGESAFRLRGEPAGGQFTYDIVQFTVV